MKKLFFAAAMLTALFTSCGDQGKEVLFNGQTFWLTQKRMADLYGVEVSTINYHLRQIYETGELKEEATIRKNWIVQTSLTGTWYVSYHVVFPDNLCCGL